MDSISFNDTIDYKHMRIFGAEGVFTKTDIDITSLPKEFHVYALLGNAPGALDAISLTPQASMPKIGFFITKAEPSLGKSEVCSLHPDDIVYLERTFSMEDYFGVKESIDLIIAQADSKRLQQMGNDLDTRTATMQGEGRSGQDYILDT